MTDINLNLGVAGQKFPYSMKKNDMNFSRVCVDIAYNVDKTAEYGVKVLNAKDKLSGSGWEVLMNSKEQSNTAEYGYKAVAFINKETKAIEIASAGTKLDRHDLLDDLLIALHKAPNKCLPVQNFLDAIITKIGGVEQAQEYTFGTSGHSLGAIVADFTAGEICSRGLKLSKSVTMDSPGSAEVMKYAIDNKLFNGPYEVTVEELAKHSEIYNAKPNIINTTNNHLGKLNLVVWPSAKEQDTSVTSEFSGWWAYLYNKVGSAIKGAVEYLGISSVLEGLSNHKLHNFSDADDVVAVSIADWTEQILGSGNYTQQLKNTKSTGNDVVLLEDSCSVSSTDEDYASLVYVEQLEYSYWDLQVCARAVQPIGDVVNTSNAILVS
jgi:hypothetical protein